MPSERSPRVRLATKFTLALGAAGLVLFGGYGWYRAVREEALLRAGVEQELRVLGRSLQVSIEHALRDQQLADIQETISDLEKIAPPVDILVYDASGEIRAASKGSQPTEALEGAAATRAQAERGAVFTDVDERPRIAFGLPLLSTRGDVLGAVVIGYPLGGLEREIALVRRELLLVVLIFTASTAMVSMILGVFHVGRPLGRLVEAMRRVTSGDLSAQLHTPIRRDEVGDLVRAFNAMTIELQHAHARLVEEVERRLLVEAGLAQADKLIAVGQLAATLAHEIGSPLQVLVGRARALAGRDYPPDRVKHHAQSIADQGERITGIVADLLAYARRRSGSAQPVTPSSAAQPLLDLLEVEAERRHVALALRDETDGAKVMCDPDRLQQVVFNLVRNALDASHEGGKVELAFDRASDREGAPRVRLRVIDEGSGIAPEHLPHVFDPFFTTRADSGGSGLGLVVVQSIVRDEGGTIEIESQPGTGTTVSVTFPEHDP
jgi:signal transduction histidine kinase